MTSSTQAGFKIRGGQWKNMFIIPIATNLSTITANSRQFIFPLTRPTPLTTTIISVYKQLWKPQVGRELGTT